MVNSDSGMKVDFSCQFFLSKGKDLICEHYVICSVEGDMSFYVGRLLANEDMEENKSQGIRQKKYMGKYEVELTSKIKSNEITNKILFLPLLLLSFF